MRALIEFLSMCIWVYMNESCVFVYACRISSILDKAVPGFPCRNQGVYYGVEGCVHV